MKFKAGDHVKFLNEKGGGVVRRVIDPSTVEVSIEEGFDVPVKISDIIFDNAYVHVNHKTVEPQEMKVEAPTDQIPQGLKPSFRKQLMGIYLAFRPHRPDLPGGLTDVLLINRSEFEILYNIYHRKPEKYEGVDYGNLGENTMLVLDTCEAVGLEKWCNALFQFMMHAEAQIQPPIPASVEFKIKPSKLMHEETYQDSVLLMDPAWIHALYILEKEQDANVVVPKIKIREGDQSLIAKHRTADQEAEVDLHIEAIVDDSQKMEPSRIMATQLDYLSRCLESAIRSGYRRVVFIHGVGAGVLKIEMRKILEVYDFIEFYDASIAKYGIGATEVRIYQSRK